MTESRLRAIVETAIDGIVFMDSQGTVTMFNPACERMFGYSSDEIVGGEVKRLMPGAEHDQYLHKRRVTGRHKVIEIGREVVGWRKNGETFPVDLSVGEAEQDGEVFFVGILRDASERMRAKDLSEKLIEQLTASNLERSYFGHVASHDLREPLRMIAAFCGLLTRDYGDRLDDRGREYLSLSVSAANQMQDLLDDLVDFGRLTLDAERGTWFETGDALEVVGLDADAVVGDGETPVLAVQRRRDLDRRRHVHRDVFQRIADQVLHQPVEADRVAEDAGQAGVGDVSAGIPDGLV